jgi:hypothetical protein
MHTCHIAVKPNGEHWAEQVQGAGVECGQPATRCIVVNDANHPYGNNHTEVIWMCEAHWNDPYTHKFFNDVWDKVEY